ncbi:MAG TPA: PVC-type heme-binding CxxCH protein [Pirellulales bacterium]|nr:PVC-type heme-binding CxxCH protein [Pirellulales bacterium]
MSRSSWSLHSRMMLACLVSLSALVAVGRGAEATNKPVLQLKKGDKIVLIGNSLAERMQYFGNWETLLHSRFPDLQLVVRNLGWSADELTLRPRSQGFQDHGHRLEDEKPDVIIAAFGFNESFGGSDGLPKFQSDLENFIRETTTTSYNGSAPPQLVLLSPIAHENLKSRTLPDGKQNNERIGLYTTALAAGAEKNHVVFVDLLDASTHLMAEASSPLTINGVHLNEKGDEAIAKVLDAALFGPRPAGSSADLEKLRAAVNEKNLQAFYDYRAVNGCYIYGSRKAPFGIVNFPPEFEKLRKMVANRDQRVWTLAAGKSVPDTIDDSNTGELAPIPSNVPEDVKITSPEESQATFTLASGYQANLFASEGQFPDLRNPMAMSFDARGRLWVATMPTYPMYLPGEPVHDKLLIFEDTDGDGKADKQTVFADGLYLPTGFELGNGGVYVAQEPNIVFLKDTDGDDHADTREIILSGFDSADSHHAAHVFTWDPAGGLHWQEGIFHFSQIETPYGPQRAHDGGVYRFEPRTLKLEVFGDYPFWNPWGHYIDRWGQNFVADASDGFNYYGTPFTGQTEYPNKHPRTKPFLVKQWRPTAGCELVSSRHFPDEAQGNYLVNNCIGFQGTLQYKVREEGSGFAADPVDPILKSTDRNFRPVDMEFGPEGALYLVDWFNPLIGHMQHSIRDPKRDVNHGRIWRITYPARPLVTPAKIAGQPIPELLNLLKTYEDRTRYRVRAELHARNVDEVVPATRAWLAGLDKNDPDYWRLRLEGLWMLQAFDVVDADMLKEVLRCPEPRARAAATRVLCYWRDRVADPLALLKVQAGDEHPRVRLEAIRAASFFRGADAPGAQEVAVESLLAPSDEFLKYALDETMKTLDGRMGKTK